MSEMMVALSTLTTPPLTLTAFVVGWFNVALPVMVTVPAVFTTSDASTVSAVSKTFAPSIVSVPPSFAMTYWPVPFAIPAALPSTLTPVTVIVAPA